MPTEGEVIKLQLPNSDQAYIQPNKLTKYLLSETHSVGRSKAKFFRGLGFDETNIKELEQALLHLAKTQVVHEITETRHGRKYTIIGSITTPSGRTVTVLTVWIIDAGQSIPRFVTARPYRDN